MKKDFDDLYKEYEDMMNDEPEPPKKQQQTQAYTQPIQQQQQQRQQPPPEIQQKQAQQQASVQAPVQAIQTIQQPSLSLIELETMFTRPQDFKSFLILQKEISSIKNGLLKQGFVTSNPELLKFYNQLLGKLNAQMTQLIGFVECGQLTDKLYPKFLTESLKVQMEHLKKASSIQNQNFQKRIKGRLIVLTEENKKYSQNPSQAFKMIVSTVAPNTRVPEFKSQGPPQKQPDISKLKDDLPLGKFKSEMTADKLMCAQLDEKPVEHKYETLLKRYKEYFNLATYISAHLKEERQEYLTKQLFPLLEKGKALRQEFCDGKNPKIANYLTNELVELDFDVFHQCSRKDFIAKLNSLGQLLQDCIQLEQKFTKKTLHARAPKPTPKNYIHPTEESRVRTAKLIEALNYLKSLNQAQFVPLPKIVKENLTVNLVIENKEIPPNTLVLKLFKLSNCKFEKYYISFAFESEGKIQSKQTDICDKSCVFNHTSEFKLNTQALGDRVVELRLYEKGFISSTEIGIAQIQLNLLKYDTAYEGECQFTHKGQNIKLSFGLFVREPIGGYQVNEIISLRIEKVFPVFDKQAGMQEYLEKFMPQLPNFEQVQAKRRQEEEQQRILMEQQRQEQLRLQQEREALIKEQQKMEIEAQGQEQPQIEQQTSCILLLHQEGDPQYDQVVRYSEQETEFPCGLKKEDIVYPENAMKFTCCTYVEQYSEFYEKQLPLQRRDPNLRKQVRYMQKAWEDFLRASNILKRKLENQEFEWYQKNLEDLQKKDAALINIYQKIQCPDWQKLVEQRKYFVESELDQMKNDI